MKLNVAEALRYLGAGDAAPEELRREVEQTAREVEAQTPKYIYRVWDLVHEERGVCIPEAGMVLTGTTAKRMLSQCDRAVLLVCTLGMEFEQKLRALQARSMAKAVILDACGSAWIEDGCDAAEAEIAQKFLQCYLTDRFSPGYGDLPLEIQQQFCQVLDARRRLGVYVTESHLMSPSKSVTAVIGLSDRPQMARIRGCAYCAMKESCALRKGGKSCGL